jgi:AcrR family transcriptional regulator
MAMKAAAQLLSETGPRRFTQERARKTFEALIDAAEETFHEKGFDATQTPDIAARAGVSVGTFYRYFTDKKEIYLEVVRRHLLVAHREVLDRLTPERFANKERRTTIAEALHILFEYTMRHPAMNRVFREMAIRDTDVAELKRVFDTEGVRRLAGLVAAVTSREQVADPEATAHVVYTAVVEIANHMAEEENAEISRERFEKAVGEMIVRTLFGTA